jgi:hypothetical protein
LAELEEKGIGSISRYRSRSVEEFSLAPIHPSLWLPSLVLHYEIIIKREHCSIYYNGIFEAHYPLVNELYVLDPEDKYVCNINMKRARLNNLNSTFI